MKTERSILIPLFNVEVVEDIFVEFNLPDYIKPTTHHFLDPKIPDITVDKVSFKLSIIKCNFTKNEHETKLDGLFPTSLIANDTYRFDHHVATTVLLFSVCEVYPDGEIGNLMSQSHNSFYQYEFINSFLLSLKLENDTEPHFYKGYYSKNGMPTEMESTWPIKEMQGTKIVVTKDVFDHTFLICGYLWKLENQDRHSMAHRIFTLSASYYSLTSTQAEYAVIFIFLMIAFEALFKKPDADSINQAKNIFGKLIANSKTEYSHIAIFMSEDPNSPGCCCFRNSLMHGDENFDIPLDRVFWKLKGYIRIALQRVLELYGTASIDAHNYYNSLYTNVDNRFNKLPIK